jgi:hypothetical protein
MVREVIASVNRAPAPKRLTLGSTFYASIRAALLKEAAGVYSVRSVTATGLPRMRNIATVAEYRCHG